MQIPLCLAERSDESWRPRRRDYAPVPLYNGQRETENIFKACNMGRGNYHEASWSLSLERRLCLCPLASWS